MDSVVTLRDLLAEIVGLQRDAARSARMAELLELGAQYQSLVDEVLRTAEGEKLREMMAGMKTERRGEHFLFVIQNHSALSELSRLLIQLGDAHALADDLTSVRELCSALMEPRDLDREMESLDLERIRRAVNTLKEISVKVKDLSFASGSLQIEQRVAKLRRLESDECSRPTDEKSRHMKVSRRKRS